MTTLSWLAVAQENIGWVGLVCFGLAIASALVPWISAELIVLAAAGSLASPAGLMVVVLGVTAGQVAGKSAIYWLARSARRPPSALVSRAVARCRDKYERRPVAAVGVMFASATVGLPPFYLTSLVAGSLKIDFGTFLAVGMCGRLLHFGALAAAPGLVGGGLP